MSVNAVREDESIQSVSKKVTLTRLFKYLLAYKSSIAIVIFIMLVTVAITIINPLILERAVDVHIANRDFNRLLKLGIAAVAINILFVILVKLRMYLMAKISNHVLLTIRQELYTHIQKLSFHFFDSRPTGKILARIIGDVNSLKDVLSSSVTTLIPDFVTITAVLTIMLVKNWKLALASLISLPFMAFGMWYIETRSHHRWQLHRKKSSNLNAFIHEDLSGMRIIQSFRAEEETEEDFDQLLKEHRDSFVHAVVLNDAFGSVIDISWGVGAISMYFTAIKILNIGPDNVGTLIAFTTYIGMFWRPIMNLSNFYNQIITNLSGAERIFDILDTEPDIADSEFVKDLPEIKGEVVFDHVSFSYDQDTKVLNDVSFHITPGETIALVGPTGAGKTTIVNLISRFYDI
ncbi:MAG TPA: multidrug ABC transporter ATP-binding protein, partial [Lachnospiraceae bacterium]|nr:multidrug ABC transporter ATP-binding protein [Lachnospiraceae bacterium]